MNREKEEREGRGGKGEKERDWVFFAVFIACFVVCFQAREPKHAMISSRILNKCFFPLLAEVWDCRLVFALTPGFTCC